MKNDLCLDTKMLLVLMYQPKKIQNHCTYWINIKTIDLQWLGLDMFANSIPRTKCKWTFVSKDPRDLDKTHMHYNIQVLQLFRSLHQMKECLVWN